MAPEGAAVTIFSDRMASAAKRGLTEFRRRAAIRPLERGAEMTVAGEAELEGEGGEVVVLPQQVQGASEPQAKLIAIQRQPFDLLEYLGEIHRRATDFGSDFRERPAPRKIRRERE